MRRWLKRPWYFALALVGVGCVALAFPASRCGLVRVAAGVRDVPEVCWALEDDPSPSVRAYAARTLRDMQHMQASSADTRNVGPGPRRAQRALLSALKDPDAGVRREAAHALVRMLWLENTETVPALVEAMEDSSADVRKEVTGTLALASPQAADVPLLLTALESADPMARWAAAASLQHSPAAVRLAFPVLRQKMTDPDTGVRRMVLLAIAQLGPAAREAVPELLVSMRDEKLAVRAQAAATVGAIGEEARDAVPILLVLLQDPDEDARRCAARALGQIKHDAPNVVPALVKALNDPIGAVRLDAAEALGQFGPAAREAIPALEQLRGQDNLLNRRVVSQALRRIVPDPTSPPPP